MLLRFCGQLKVASVHLTDSMSVTQKQAYCMHFTIISEGSGTMLLLAKQTSKGCWVYVGVCAMNPRCRMSGCEDAHQ